VPAIYRLIKASLTPLIILNLAGMILAGGYLFYLGYWGALWTCILVFFLSPFIFPLFMIPAAFFGGLTQMYLTAKPKVSLAMQALSVGWLIFVIGTWGAIVFDFASPLFTMPGLLFASLVWCVCGAVTPWMVFARNDRGNIFFTGLMLMAETGCIAAALVNINHTLSLWDQFFVIGGVMALLATAQAVGEEVFLKKKLNGGV
jgi:hypothetical protein